MRILLVEDDVDLQRLLKKALGDAGYVVDVAADGEEGHFLGDTEPYDAVVLDLGLPKIDGVTVLERWRTGMAGHGVRARYEAEVVAIERQPDGFRLALKDGGTVLAENVVFAIGMQGNLRRLDVPGADLPCVQYQLDDPEEYRGEVIVVVGAGDAAIENAIAVVMADVSDASWASNRASGNHRAYGWRSTSAGVNGGVSHA